MKLRLWSVLGWVVLFALLSFSVMRMYQLRIDRYVDEQLAVLSSSIKATERTLQPFAEYVLETVVRQEHVLELIAQAWDAEFETRNELRTRLYEYLLPAYTTVARFNFRQLHVHFPDTTSFLRMHRPQRYGDHLGNVRYSVLAANLERRPVSGFEEGRIYNGYRFVYPLSYQGEHIGSAEVSFSIKSFFDVLSELTDSRYLFALNRAVVERTVFREELTNYSPSYIGSDLLFDIQLEHPNELAPLFRNRTGFLEERLQQQESFGYFFRSRDDRRLILFHALHNIRSEQVGWIISITRDDFQYRIRRDQFLAGSLLVSLFIIIQLLSWIVVSDRQELLRLSRTDQLTAILNRHWMRQETEAEIEKAARYAYPVSVILFDIDHFKNLNDTWGHNEGDRVLQRLARTVEATVRSGDRFARWGGEEFLVLLPHSDERAALQAAEKLRETIAGAELSEHAQVTISCGAAELREDEMLDSLVGRADKALYQAKSDGRNTSRAASDLPA